MTCSRKYVNKNYNLIFFKDRARVEKKKAQNLNALSMFCMLSLSTHYVQVSNSISVAIESIKALTLV